MNLPTNKPVHINLCQMKTLEKEGVKFSLITSSFVDGHIWVLIND